MTKILIVANRSMTGDALATAVKERIEAGPCEFHVVVPLPSPVSSVIAIGAAAADMTPTACFDVQSERDAAQERLEAAMAWCVERGVTATGGLSADADVVKTVASLVESESFDEVIVSTLPTTISRWLHQDLPRRIERKVSVPVTTVTPA